MNYSKHKAIEDGLADFFRCCHSKQYPARSILTRPGDAANSLYYLREGSVSITMENDQGEELILAYLNPGDFLGEVGFFSDVADAERSVTIRARTDCRTEEISYLQLRQLCETELKTCYPILLQFLAEQMARRLLSTTRKMSDLVFLDVAGRVEAALNELALQPDAIKHPDGMQIKITRQEISRMVGCSREMAGRVLKQLQKDGVLWSRGKTLVLFDDTK